ncbi:MAG: hypothetical protein KDA37_01055 [Planctomycetales bacterium]|nr:hypothetical protein [Planctomycetales bacterium]
MQKKMAAAALMTGLVAFASITQPAAAAADQGFNLRGPGSSKTYGHFQVWGGGEYVRQAECKISIAPNFRATGSITIRRFDALGNVVWQQSKLFKKAQANAGLLTAGDPSFQSTKGAIVCDVQATLFKRGQTWGVPRGSQSFNIY